MSIENNSASKKNTQVNNEKEKEIKLLEVRRHWKKNGHLGVTADDHRIIGGTPDLELRQNPGKTLGELWEIDKIREYLKKIAYFLEKAREEYKRYDKDSNNPDSHWSRDDIISAKKSLRSAIYYLESIKKLPEEFKNYKVEDFDNDPEKV